MSTLEQLKSATSLDEAARVLGYQPKGLAYILYKIPHGQKYSSFTIQKKSGGLRSIKAPDARLKALQIKLRKVLEECNLEISPLPDVPKSIRPSIPKSLSHGFEKNRSIVTNAWAHKNRRFVLNIDLEDFFPSINFGRVRGFFMKNRNYALNEKIATIIAQIACHDNELPQGSPCSPIISNLVAHLLDVRLANLAKQMKCSYTRYADDLTFSTNQKIFPPDLAQEEPDSPSIWMLGENLRQTINRTGFRINDQKTRMQCRPSQQIVTGLTVNAKVNIQASYYRSARAMCNTVFKTGKYYLKPPSPSPLVPSPPVDEHTDMACLEGILSHIYYVKHLSDRMSGDQSEPIDEKDSKKQKVDVRRKYPAHRELYKKFLYFKHFVNLDMPLIVCEGKTDNIYLRSALKALVGQYPNLAELDGMVLKAKVRYLRHSRVEHNILDLSGGSSNLANLVARYQKAVYRYPYRPLAHPVIILIDNDSGSCPVFKAIKSSYKTEITITSTSLFYYVCHNLYLIKTPEIGSSSVSCIESLFKQEVLDTKLAGKSFSMEKEFNGSTHYGKFDFADRVVRANIGNIDFSGFNGLFDRVVAVIEDYKKRVKS